MIPTHRQNCLGRGPRSHTHSITTKNETTALIQRQSRTGPRSLGARFPPSHHPPLGLHRCWEKTSGRVTPLGTAGGNYYGGTWHPKPNMACGRRGVPFFSGPLWVLVAMPTVPTPRNSYPRDRDSIYPTSCGYVKARESSWTLAPNMVAEGSFHSH